MIIFPLAQVHSDAVIKNVNILIDNKFWYNEKYLLVFILHLSPDHSQIRPVFKQIKCVVFSCFSFSLIGYHTKAK